MYDLLTGGPAPARATYRPDIDGLRGIAVLAVVLYHAGFTRFFGGGFVGVDIFFVISGYLITGIIYREYSRGAFSFLNFYERRIRRIVPAFFVMAVVCTLLAGLILPPGSFKSHGVSLLRASLCTANFHFLRHTGGYFDAPTHSFALLHTWSLSVEEQFYFVFPTVLFILMRLFPRRFVAIVAGLALASLLAASVLVGGRQSFVFYMLPTRAWELLGGALLALMPPPRLSLKAKNLCLGLGLLCIAATVAGYGLKPDLPFPGLAAAPPCLGAMLCILGGTDRDRTGFVYGVLSWRPLVLLGLISYSLYLWHWPVLALYRTALVEPEPSFGVTLLLLVLSLALAACSWKFVEQPVRRKKILGSRTTLFLGGLLSLGILALSGWAIYKEKIPPLLPADTSYNAGAQGPVSLPPPPERLRPVIGDRAVFFGDPDLAPSILVLGDSHADALAPLFDRLGREQGRAGLLASHHPPFFNSRLRQDKTFDATWQNHVETLLRQFHPDTVLLVDRYAIYADGFLPQETAPAKIHSYNLIHTDAEGRETSAPHQAFQAALRDTLDACRAAGVRRTFILLPIPEQACPIPETANKLAFFGIDPATRLFIPLADYRKRQAYVLRALADIAAETPGVTLVDPVPALCPDGARCNGVRDGRSLYFDDDHLSLAGGDLLADVLTPAFQKP